MQINGIIAIPRENKVVREDRSTFISLLSKSQLPLNFEYTWHQTGVQLAKVSKFAELDFKCCPLNLLISQLGSG